MGSRGYKEKPIKDILLHYVQKKASIMKNDDAFFAFHANCQTLSKVADEFHCFFLG